MKRIHSTRDPIRKNNKSWYQHRNMRQLTIFYLLLTTFSLNAFCFTANEKARHFISNLLEDRHSLKNSSNRTKRQTRIKTQYPVMPNYWRHGPSNPQFTQLINQLSQIIPGQAVRTRWTIFSFFLFYHNFLCPEKKFKIKKSRYVHLKIYKKY